MKKKKQPTKVQVSLFPQIEKPKTDSKVVVNVNPPKTCPVCKGTGELIDTDLKFSEPLVTICWYCKGK